MRKTCASIGGAGIDGTQEIERPKFKDPTVLSTGGPAPPGPIKPFKNEQAVFALYGNNLPAVEVSPSFFDYFDFDFGFSGIGIRFWGTGDFGTNEMGQRDGSGKTIYDIDIDEFNNFMGLGRDFKIPGGSRYNKNQRKNVNPGKGQQEFDAANDLNKKIDELVGAHSNRNPDTISAKTVLHRNGKIYRLDTIKHSYEKWKILERRIDKWGKIIK